MQALRFSLPRRHAHALLAQAAVLLALCLGGAVAARAEALPDLYIDNRKFAGGVARIGRDLFIDAEAAAGPLKRVFAPGTPPTLDGHPLPSARAIRGKTYVRLDELATAADARVQANPTVGIVDIITFDPKARARVVDERERARQAAAARSMPRPGATGPPTSDGDLEAIYQLSVTQLRTILGIRLTVEPRRHFVPVAEIRREMESNAALGYTNALFSGGTLTLDVYVAQGLSYEQTLHVMLHELTHCWQHGEGLNTSTRRLTEGFAEWAAAFILKGLGYADEVRRINDNLLEDYAEGFRYFERRAAAVGPILTVEDMRQHKLSR